MPDKVGTVVHIQLYQHALHLNLSAEVSAEVFVSTL